MSRLRGAVATLVLVAVAVSLVGCSGGELAAGEGDSMADRMYVAVKPVAGEQMMKVRAEDTTPYLRNRVASASSAHPDWQMQNVGPYGETYGDVRSMVYRFRDGSTITFYGQMMEGTEGVRMTRVEVER